MANFKYSHAEVQEGIFARIRMDVCTGKVEKKFPGETDWRKTDVEASSIEEAEEMVSNSHR